MLIDAQVDTINIQTKSVPSMFVLSTNSLLQFHTLSTAVVPFTVVHLPTTAPPSTVLLPSSTVGGELCQSFAYLFSCL